MTESQDSPKSTIAEAIVIIFDSLVNYGALATIAKLEAYRASRPCRTANCIGIRGHFGPCFDGDKILKSSRFRFKIPQTKR